MVAAQDIDYAQDFDVSIEGGVGEATVLVPSEVGVRVRAEGGLDKINAEGFQRDGEAYVNDAYGDRTFPLTSTSGAAWVRSA